MLSTIYTAGFALSLFSLIMWYYFQENRKMSRLMGFLFFVGFVSYVAAVLSMDGDLQRKLMMACRDLVILGGTGYFFGLMSKNRLVFFAFLALLYGAFQYKFFGAMQSGYEQLANVQPTSDLYAEGELLVQLDESFKINTIQNILDKYGLTATPAFNPESEDLTDLENYYLIDIPESALNNLSVIKMALADDLAVLAVEGNEVYQLDELETTPLRRVPRAIKKFGLNDPGVGDLWGFQEMQVDQLYQYLKKEKIKPVKKARIFILDTGVDAQHEDLKDNYRSLKTKYDKDPKGHGTHCAGIAAAVSNNGRGVASFSQRNEFVEVTSITVLSSFGGGTQNGIIKGIIEAADKGADVISMSLGGRSNDSRQKAYQDAVLYANKKGAIVIAAAGNSNDNAKNYAPANAPGAITVSAIDTSLNRASFSNYIQEVDYGIAAPGVQIYSTIPNNKYAFFNGTSMATPYVAGLVGLMKSLQPDLTTKQAHDILAKTGAKTGNTRETGPFIQPAAAIKFLRQKN